MYWVAQKQNRKNPGFGAAVPKRDRDYALFKRSKRVRQFKCTKAKLQEKSGCHGTKGQFIALGENSPQPHR